MYPLFCLRKKGVHVMKSIRFALITYYLCGLINLLPC